MTTAYTVTGLRIVRLEPAHSGGWWLGFASADTGVFIEAVGVVKALPYDERRFDANERAWWIAGPAMQVLAELLPDVGDALRSWQQDGSTASSSRSSGRQRQTRRTRNRPQSADSWEHVPADTRDAFTRLHLLPSAPPELVKVAHRIAAKRLHPDKGGEHRRMVACNLAAEQALLWAESHDEQSDVA